MQKIFNVKIIRERKSSSEQLESSNFTPFEEKIRVKVIIPSKPNNEMETISHQKRSISALNKDRKLNVWSCPLCPATTFQTKASFLTHLQCRKHQGIKPYICKACPVSNEGLSCFSSAANLRTHAINCHIQRSRICEKVLCVPCGRKWDKISSFITHFKEEHSKKDITRCPICLLCYPDDTTLEKHLHFHRNDKVPEKTYMFSCEICSEVFAENRDLITHFLFYHEIQKLSDLIGCPRCGAIFSQMDSFIRHARICTPDVTGMRNVIREEASRLSANQSPLNTSSTQKHSENLEQVEFSSQSSAAVYHCEVCNEYFSTALNLASHCEAVHVLQDEATACPDTGNPNDYFSRFQCSECGHGFDRIAKLKTHMLTHQISLGGHKCSMCDLVFSWKSECDKHIQFDHRDQLPYSCPVCFKRFSATIKLRVHMDTHEKKRQCTVCSKRFANKHGLDRHMLIHNNQKPYACVYCSIKFRHMFQLKTHIKKSHIMPVLDGADNDSEDIVESQDSETDNESNNNKKPKRMQRIDTNLLLSPESAGISRIRTISEETKEAVMTTMINIS